MFISLMGSFLGSAKIQGAPGRWLAQGATLMAGKCIWISSCGAGWGEEPGGALARGSLVGEKQPWVVLSLPSVIFHALIGMLAATDAAQNQYSVKIFFSPSLFWARVASC